MKTVVLLAVLILLSYYWTIHPIVLWLVKIVKRIRQWPYSTNNRLRLSNTNTIYAYLVIPTFGKRDIIIKKIDYINKLFESSEIFNRLIRKVIIVYSKPDAIIARDLIRKIYSNSHLANKYEIILEGYRGGKASAINAALRVIDNNLKGEEDAIIIVNDDDSFFEPGVLGQALQEFLVNKKLGVISFAPEYNSSEINLFYKLKRSVHKLEEMLCIPAAIYGDMLIFRRKILKYLNENTLAEDVQISLTALTNGYKVKLLVGNVRERYPLTFKGIISRTKRTITGTFIEYVRALKKLIAGRKIACIYILSSYTTSLLLLPITIIYVVYVLIIPFSSALTKMSMLSTLIPLGDIATLAAITLLILALMVTKWRKHISRTLKFVLAVLVGGLLSYVDILRLTLYSPKEAPIGINFEKMWSETK